MTTPQETLLKELDAMLDQVPIGTVVIWSDGSDDPEADALAHEWAERMRRPGGIFGG